jgi:hypothetical protein
MTQQPEQTPTPLLLTETEASKILGFSVRTLQGWRYRGGGPRFVRVSNACIRYRRQDLTAWVEARLRWSTSDDGTGTAPCDNGGRPWA